MRSKWEFYRPYEPQAINKIINQFKIPRPVARVLYNRGLTERDDIISFVKPTTESLCDPFLMKDMDLAVSRIITALRERETILIHGDYDVDGITSVSLLYLFLKDLGGDVTFYIPDRVSEGYGLSKGGVEEADNRNCNLIISVDCGVTSVEEVLYAKKYGIDIIVSDHHEPGEALPEAVAVVDPKRKDCDYPFKDLAGVGVAYKICQGVSEKLGLDPNFSEKYLDLVAIGTSADIVPLIGENRIFAKVGLEKLNEANLEGIVALAEIAGLEFGNIEVGHIIYGLAPRINAVGRLGHASPAVEMLITRNQYLATKLAQKLEQTNRERKEIDTRTLQEALDKINLEYDSSRDSAIVIAGKGWHPGVIGIVASRIIERYYRPTVMISVENGIGKGSARSIPGFDIHSALKGCSEYLAKFGGHKYAAGLTIEEKNIPKFKECFNHIAKDVLTKDDIVPKIKIDDELELNQIDQTLVDKLNKLRPFGPANSRPLFVSQGVNIIGEPRIVGRDHLKFRAGQNGSVIDAIAFGMGSDLPLLKSNNLIDLVYYIDENHWNNRTNIQLKIKDLH